MPIRVLAAVVHREDRVLICRRPAHKRHGNLWEFPGGKVEAGESDLEAAQRELDEELAVAVTGVGAVTFSVHDPGSEFVIEFLPVAIDGEPQAMEHSEMAWVTYEESLTYELAPSDRRYVQHFVTAPLGQRES